MVEPQKLHKTIKSLISNNHAGLVSKTIASAISLRIAPLSLTFIHISLVCAPLDWGTSPRNAPSIVNYVENSIPNPIIACLTIFEKLSNQNFQQSKLMAVPSICAGRDLRAASMCCVSAGFIISLS